MARTSQKLIEALRKAAEQIEIDHQYQWGHMGCCNCGYVAQNITSLSSNEIHDYALRGHGDWSEQVEAFCPTSKFPMDLLISELVGSGLTLQDLVNLERLRDPDVLAEIPKARRDDLKHNRQEDVVLYLRIWADILEKKLREKTTQIFSSAEHASLEMKLI